MLVKIAVSACLMGEACRYDGTSKPCGELIPLLANHEILPICPEVAGGLPTPRTPSEIVCTSGSARAIMYDGTDVTEQFEAGARLTLEAMRSFGCEMAILKAKSPSCGSGLIYDGSFSGTLTEGWGIAARMICDAGIPVFDETTDLRSLLAS